MGARIGKNICTSLNKKFLSIYYVFIILIFMEKKLAVFISEQNFRFKLNLAQVIAREMNVKMPKPAEEMSIAEILAVSPKMQEWILYRLLWLYVHSSYVTEIQDDLRQNTNYGEAVDFGSMVLRVVYSHFKGLKNERVSFKQYCEALAKTKFFQAGRKCTYRFRFLSKMVMLEMFVEEDGDIPTGEMLVMDEARNVFTIRFVNSLDDGRQQQKVQETACQKQERSC